MMKEDKRGVNLLDIFRIAIIAIVAVVIVIVLPASAGTALRSSAAERMVLDRMIFNSVSSFSYVDGNGYAHPGLIDYARFNQESLDKAISIPKKVGVKVSLFSDDGKIAKEIYLNDDYALLGKGFMSSFDVVTAKEPVLIKDNGRISQGHVEVTYVIKKNR